MLKLYKEEGVKRDRPLYVRDTTTETEQVGYVDTEAQVRRMLLAGENLMEYHRKAYDYPEGEFDLKVAQPDPTLDVGFDPADADYYMRRVKSSLAAAKAAKAKVTDKEKDVAKEEEHS